MASISTSDTLPIERPSEAGRLSEEWCNYLTHGVGTVLSLAGAFVLLTRLEGTEDRTLVLGCGVYIATLIAVYACSTLSHFFERPRLRRTFRILDQACIYLLIVGTYTPVAVTFLHGGRLSVLFWAMWGIALIGFLSKILLRHRIDAISVVLYVALGWMPILEARTAWSLLPGQALLLFFLGGLCYTGGVVFLTRDTRVRYFHAVWHLLVMAGSALHFQAVLECLAAVV